MVERPIVLFGSKKHVFDFEVLFREIQIDGYLVEKKENQVGNSHEILENNFMNHDIYDFGQLKQNELKDKLIIVCEQKSEVLLKKMEEEGATYGQDFVFVSDCFSRYSPAFLEKGQRRLVIWGADADVRAIYKDFKERELDSEIAFFIDSNKESDELFSIPVKSPETITDWSNLYVIVATRKYHWEIYEQLEKQGMKYRKDYVHASEVKDYSEMLYKVFFSKENYKYVCNRPFGTCDVIGSSIYLCCPDFLGVSPGNIRYMSFEQAWNSYVARILRLSVCNGTFAFCDKQYCDKELKTTDEEKEYRMLEERKYPGSLMVGIDYSCNLKCPSCRKELCVVKGEEREEIFRQAEELLEHIIPYVDHLWLAGNGEVFFSPVYLSILQDERCRKRKNIGILSNGTLFNEKNWELLKGIYQEILVVISIDGIQNETIEKLRLGANAETLKNNLSFLGKLREKKQINFLGINFVLQSENIAEMADLLQFCKENHIERFEILRLHPHASISDEDFDRLSVFDQNGAIKQEYLHYFNEEFVKDERIDWADHAKLLGLKEYPRLGIYDLL